MDPSPGVALLLVVAPAAVGAAIRRTPVPRRRTGLAVLAVLAAAVPLASRVNPWDAVVAWALAAAVAAAPVGALVGGLVFVGTAEAILHAPGVRVVRYERDVDAQVLLPRVLGPWQACTVEDAPRDAPRRWLHLGDSLVAGYLLPKGAPRFTDLLTAADPTIDHLNGGRGGIGTDCQLVMLRRLPRDLPLERVVLWAYPNDLLDVRVLPGDPPRAAAVALPEDAPVPASRHEASTAFERAVSTPPPWALRQASHHARLPAALLHAWYAAQTRLAPRPAPPYPLDALGPAFGELLRAMQDEAHARGAAFSVVVLPTRPEMRLDAAGHAVAHEPYLHDTLLAHVRASGVPVVDGWDEVASWYADLGDDLYVKVAPGDVHYDAEGHRRWAAWVERLFATELAAPP